MASLFTNTQIHEYSVTKFGIILLLFFSFHTQAQTDLHTKNKKAIREYTIADNSIRNRDFDLAKTSLNNAIKYDDQFIEAYFKLASIYMLYGKNNIAKDLYLQGAKLDTNWVGAATAYYTIGELSMKEGDYVTAKKYLQYVINVHPNNKKLADQTPILIQNCDFAFEALKNKYPLVTRALPEIINSSYIQAYPVLTADRSTLIFSSRKGQRSSDDENILQSTWDGKNWSTPVILSKSLSTGYNEGACSMSGDGNTVVFSSCNRPGGIGSCDIYIAYKTGDQWSEPQNLGRNINSSGWDSEPSISADGKVLYYSSERSGGLGKEDIYVSYLQKDGTWSLAKNLGPTVNSKGRDVSPFIHASGNTLYFSTNARPGMGEFDIFKTNLNDTVWSEPVNLGYPLNNAESNATLFITADNQKGYYSVYDKLDQMNMRSLIYEFDVPDPIKASQTSTYAQGKVFDAITKKPLKANIELYDLSNAKRVQWVNSDSINGKYTLVLSEGKQYALNVNKEGYLFESNSFDYSNQNNFDPLQLDFYLQPISKGARLTLRNLFFENNSAVLNDKSQAELNKLLLFLNEHTNLNIEIAGYTDNIGSDMDNMNLSNARAKAVVDYLTLKGIAKTRLTAKGYGKANPIADNNTELGRSKNRRIELKIN
jgi:OOP family OmpA-OmpF porin